jgi:uncharacterized protein
MRVPVAALVGNPGETLDHHTTIQPEDLELAGEIAVGPVEVDLTLEGVVEGVLATGTLTFDLHRPCARCLTEIVEQQQVQVTEVYFDPARREPGDEDDPGYDLVEDASAIDLFALVHDGVLIDQPVRTLCKPDCAGLCVVCGVDRNIETCDCDTAAPADPRWAALAEVRLDQSD